jgi:type VI secretion system secreted protein Hcp
MADDMFLKIDGIKGESLDAKHKGDIDIESYSWGLTNSEPQGGGGGGGAGKATFDGISFVAKTSLASPPLFLAAASGKHMKEAMLIVRHAGKEQLEYIKIKLTDLTVASYQQDGDVPADRPTDVFSLRFNKIDFSYSRQKPDGTLDAPITAGWDVQKNSKI